MSQRLWLQKQKQCQTKECLKKALQNRIKELTSWSDSQKSRACSGETL